MSEVHKGVTQSLNRKLSLCKLITSHASITNANTENISNFSRFASRIDSGTLHQV